MIYGSIIDLTCIHWDSYLSGSTAGDVGAFQDGDQQQLAKGACRAYRNDTFRLYLHSLTAFVMFLAFVFDCVICKYASQVDFYDKTDASKLTAEEDEEETVAGAGVGPQSAAINGAVNADDDVDATSELKKSTETI